MTLPADSTPEADFDAGVALQGQGRFVEAVAAYVRTLAADPGHERALYNLGLCGLQVGDVAGAVACFRVAVTLNDANVAAWIGLGRALCQASQPDEALVAFQRASLLGPALAAPFRHMGAIHLAAGNVAAAVTCFRTVCRLRPDDRRSRMELAYAEWERGDAVSARAAAAPLVADGAFGQAAAELIVATWEGTGHWAEAEAAYDSLLASSPSMAARIYGALMAPAIPRTPQEARQFLDRAARRLSAVVDAPGEPGGPIHRTPFPFAYFGLDDRELQRHFAAALAVNQPALATFRAPAVPRPAPDGRRRLGFLSHYLGDGRHIVHYANRNMLAAMDRRRFEVALVIPAGAGVTDDLRRCVDVIHPYHPADVVAAARQIADAGLDALVYTDIGMDAFTHQLGLARLAPVQCVLGGHPVTTGLPQMDYFLSSRWFEPPEAQDQYTEQLIAFEDHAVCFPRPQRIEPCDLRDLVGVGRATTLYGCLQATFKLDFAFDAALARILAGDATGIAVLAASSLTGQWLDRFTGQYGDLGQRIRFLPHVPYPRFCGALQACDALLDPFYFSGGTTTYAAFATGSPVVTVAAPALRGRCATGLYRRMGIPDLIASDPNDYARKALRLAHDRAWAQVLRATILERSASLFDRTAGLDEMGDFLEAAVAAAGRGERLKAWPLPADG